MWTEWNGGECPLDKDSKVYVEFRGGYVDKGFSAGWYSGWGGSHDHWVHENSKKDIVRYRIVKGEICD